MKLILSTVAKTIKVQTKFAFEFDYLKTPVKINNGLSDKISLSRRDLSIMGLVED